MVSAWKSRRNGQKSTSKFDVHASPAPVLRHQVTNSASHFVEPHRHTAWTHLKPVRRLIESRLPRQGAFLPLFPRLCRMCYIGTFRHVHVEFDVVSRRVKEVEA